MDAAPAIYAPFSKIDLEKQEVYGYASTPKRDQQGEIIQLEAVRASLPSYMQAPAVREMHQPSAVGTGIEGVIDQKGLWFGAKVIDPVAWAKVKSGVYRGFSIGGRVTSRDPNDKTIVTGIDLCEISLVDRPCNPEALFDIIKRADENILHKRAGHHLESGRFVTVAQSRDDAVEQANHHEAAAVMADKKAEKHRRRAAKAEKDADAQGIVVHSALAETQAALADKHRGAATQYRHMADGMAAQKLAPDDRGEIGVMGKIEDLLTEAQTLINGLAKAVEVSGTETEGGLTGTPHEQPVQNDAKGVAGDAAHHQAEATRNAHHANGNEGHNEGKHVEHAVKGDIPNGGSDAAGEGQREEAGKEKGVVEKDIGPVESKLDDEAGGAGESHAMKMVKLKKLLNFQGAFYDKEGHFVMKREFSDEKRKELASSGAAMSDGSFPIENKEDLHNAIQAHGRAKNPEKAKHHIVARAKALGAASELPDGWHKVEKSEEEPTVTKTVNEGGVAGTEDEEKCDKVLRLALVSQMLHGTEFFLSKFAAGDSELKKWAEQGLALLKADAEESCGDMEDDKEDEEKCDKLFTIANDMIAPMLKAFVWPEVAAQIVDQSMVKATKTETLEKRAGLSKQFRKGMRHLKKAHKRMQNTKKQQLMQKGADLFAKIGSTTALPTNEAKPGTSPDTASQARHPTKESGGENSGSGKNADTVDKAEKALQSMTKQLAPLLRVVQENKTEMEKMRGENNALKVRLATLENQPVDTARKGGKNVLRVVEKGQDAAGNVPNEGLGMLTASKSDFVRKLEDLPAGHARAEALLRTAYVSNKS